MHLQAFDHYRNGEPEIRLLRRLCPKDATALDIGANIGTYTYFLARYASQVRAYEPNPVLAARLAALFPRVCVRSVAVSNAASELVLKVPVESGRQLHELASVAQGFDAANTVAYKVQAITIDSERLDNVGFIKIDVEQHEREVLRGALDTIARCRPIVMTEVTPLLYAHDLREEFRFVTDLGYEGWFSFEGNYFRFAEFEPTVHANPKQFATSFMSSNIFFVPKHVDGRSLFQS